MGGLALTSDPKPSSESWMKVMFGAPSINLWLYGAAALLTKNETNSLKIDNAFQKSYRT